VSLFIISASLTFCAYTLELAGAGLTEVFKSLNFESLEERSGEKEIHTPSERKPEGWIDCKFNSFKEAMKVSAGKFVKNGFLKSTVELTANNQKIVISKLEPFVTQKNTQPASEFGVDTGNIKAPHYFSAVKLEDDSYRLLECNNVKTAVKMYDDAVKQAGAQNKFGTFARVGMEFSSFFGLDYSTDQCIEVPQTQSKEVAEMFKIPHDKVVHTSSNTELAPLKISDKPEIVFLKLGNKSEIAHLSPLNSPSNKFTDVSNW
jgi:hypothetical protein